MGKFFRFQTIPYSLGLEVDHGQVIQVIKKNSKLPAESKNLFTTILNDQYAAEIHILKGESRFVDGNQSLARIVLPGIRSGSRRPQIEVTLLADINGFIEVNVLDIDSRREVYFLVTDLTADDLFVGKSRDFENLRNKVSNLVSYGINLCRELKGLYTESFEHEIYQVLYDAKIATGLGSEEKLKSCQLFLETIINELIAIKNLYGRKGEN